MTIEGYRIERELSRGPITTVYLATQLALDRPVLLKVLNVQWRREKDLVERFRREARICARLQHAHIVTILDFGVAQEAFYLVMEYIEGQNLETIIQRSHPLPWPVIQAICVQLFQALAYAHQQGVIHRDVKPANIMVGRDGVVRLTDFGLAIIQDWPGITQQGAVVGTPAYMAPEQAMGQPVTPACDLFSAGVTLYTLACGHNPFQAENSVQTLQQLLQKQPPSVHKLRPDLPPAFSTLVQQLMEKDPSRRPPSAREVLKHPVFEAREGDQELLQTFLQAPKSLSSPSRQFDSQEIKPAPSAPRTRLRWFWLSPLLLGFILFFLWQWQPWSSRTGSGKHIFPSAAEDTAETSSTAALPQAAHPVQQLNQKETSRGDTGQSLPDRSGGESASPAVRRTQVKQTASPPPQPKEGDDANALAREEGGPVPPPATLHISCVPWARVYVDGAFQGITPLEAPLHLTAGAHLLELRNPTHQPYQDTLQLQPGAVESLQVVLKPAVGFLWVQVNPWAHIFVDDQLVETTPLQKPLILPAGKHWLRLENPGFLTWEAQVEIAPGDTLFKQISLKAGP